MSDQTLRRLAAAVLAVSWLCVAVGIILFVQTQGWTRPEPPYGYMTGGVVLPLVGLIVLRHQPRHLIGWILLVPGLMLTLGLLVGELGKVDAYQTHEGDPLAAVLQTVLQVWATMGFLGFLLLFFPTGHLLSGRWQVVPAVLVAAVGLNTASQFSGNVVFFLPGGILAIAGVVAAVASVFVRYGRAGPTERLQLRWFLSAAVASLVLLVSTGLWDGAVDRIVDALLPMLLGGAIAVAVLRYRLYEIDRIISRTLAYTLILGSLAGLYAAVVVGGPALLGLPDNAPDWLVAATTLAVVALFRPVQSRVRTLVDRRFDRRRYDGARMVEDFGRSLRDDVNLDEITARLQASVTEALRPATMSLWIPERLGR